MNIAIEFDDATTGIMQLLLPDDQCTPERIAFEIGKSAFSAKPAGWRVISPTEADAIRAARSKP